MSQQSDLVEIVARFDPKIVKMCGDGSKPEDRGGHRTCHSTPVTVASYLDTSHPEKLVMVVRLE